MPTPPTPSPINRHDHGDLNQVVIARELFWHNVIREILTSLSVLSLKAQSRPSKPTSEPTAEDSAKTPEPEAADTEQDEARSNHTDDSPPSQTPTPDDMFDGRLAVVTRLGDRIPIAEVFPLFACGIGDTSGKRALSVAVECTIFQIKTPSDEVYTLPLHEIRGFHALSPEIMKQLEESTRSRGSGLDKDAPFGFAAFTSLANDHLTDQEDQTQ